MKSLLRISSRSQYGLRLITQIAQNCWGPVSIAEIAKKEKLSPKYLEEIVRSLKRARLVTSSRGAEGGYRLTKSPKEIKIKEVIKALEKPDKAGSKSKKIASADYVWQQLTKKLDKELNAMTLAEIISKTKSC